LLVFQLKRKIEKEFAELYPQEPPFVVAKIQDREGFAVSGSSKVSDVVGHGDIVYALQSTDQIMHGGQDSREHV
jgi:hypothetical protein